MTSDQEASLPELPVYRDPELAASETPKAQQGTWTLTAPDGRTWQADSPLKACAAESRERIPPAVALARIVRGMDDFEAEEAAAPQVAQEPVAFADVPRSDLLDKTLRQYAHRLRIETCGAWSDVCSANSDLDEAKCQFAAAKEQQLKSVIDELADLSRAAPIAAPAGWIPVSERPPAIGQWIWACCMPDPRVWAEDWAGNPHDDYMTHWMPLLAASPTAPDMKKGGT
jgi:hypothetical protein